MDARDLLAGQVVAGRYRLGPLLGRGGMAEVRSAEDVRLGRPVAVKFLDGALAARPDLRRRFEDEARSAARLNHPSVVCVFDSGEWEGRPFLVMEMLSGRTLATEMAAGPLPVARVRAVIGDLLSALTAAHAAGVIHRDVKPANLLLGADGSVKVSDFGIAKADPLMGDDTGPGPATMTGQVLGTPSYVAPERLAGRPATAASDLWSVGIVGWEALAGRRAYPEATPLGAAMAVMNTDMPPVRSVRPDVDPWLATAIDGALRRDPAERWPTAASMRDMLMSGGGRGGPTAAWDTAGGAGVGVAAGAAAGAAVGAGVGLGGQHADTLAAAPGTATAAYPGSAADPGLAAAASATSYAPADPAPAGPSASTRTRLLAAAAILLVVAIAAISPLVARSLATSTSGAATTATTSAPTSTTTPPSTTAAPPATKPVTTNPTQPPETAAPPTTVPSPTTDTTPPTTSVPVTKPVSPVTTPPPAGAAGGGPGAGQSDGGPATGGPATSPPAASPTGTG